jgi:hypothetical protein
MDFWGSCAEEGEVEKDDEKSKEDSRRDPETEFLVECGNDISLY